MDTIYDVAEWAAETTRGRHVFNYNFHLLGNELRGWELLKVVTMESGQGLEDRVYLWKSKADAGRDLIRVEIAEPHEWRLAQGRLHDQLKHSMRPVVPRGTGKLMPVGDVNFVGRDPQSDVAAAISFTRGNVFVAVMSVGARNVDVSEIAARIDHLLSASPTKAEREKKHVRVRGRKAVVVKAEAAHVLIESLEAAAPRGEWLKVIAPEGELTRRGDALVYLSSEGGKKTIGTYVMSKVRP